MLTVILFYCVAVAYGSWSAVADTNITVQTDDEVSIQQTSNHVVTEFVGIGYNIVRGNPEGDFDLGGIDSGYRLAYKIFKLTYADGKTAIYENKDIPIPDQMEYQTAYSCSSAERAYTFTGTKSYQKKLSIYVKVKGSFNSGLTKAKFSASSGYEAAESGTSDQKLVILDKTVVCNEGGVRYLYDTATNNNYSISDDFYYAVKKLPTTYDENAYFAFIENWGTHFVENVNIGGRYISRFKSTYNEIYRYAKKNVDSSLSASGSHGGYSASFTLDIAKFNEQSSRSTTFGESTSIITSGSAIIESNGGYRVDQNDPHTPIPIKLVARLIVDALVPGLWTVLPEAGVTYTSLNIATKLTHLNTALSAYAVQYGRTPTDPVLKFADVWPDGTFSLPKHRRGCPDGVTSYGWRYQDCKNAKSQRNVCDAPGLDSTCNKDWKLSYCTKPGTNDDLGLAWPKGSYCICKKQGACPSGFGSGYINWDDHKRSTRNGVLPDGIYDRSKTTVFYCCRTDAHPNVPITLPTAKPFYLLKAHEEGCQKVNGMNVAEQFNKLFVGKRSELSGSHPYGTSYKKNGRHYVEVYYCRYQRK